MNKFEIEADIAFFEKCLELEEPYGNIITVNISKQICERAIKALEKQIPKKPILRKLNTRFQNSTVYSCPMCTNDFNSDGHTIDKFARKHVCHHCKCGQAIDWREVE